jgi:hypothetical protein
MTKDASIEIARRAIRLCADDGSLTSFAQHEKTLLDNADFLYWVVQLAKLDEREVCAKVCEETTASWTQHLYNEGCIDCAKAIRASGQA